MKIQPFELERWQSIWENKVELNISESGVEPLTVHELVDDPAALEKILNVRLGYPQTNGSEELRGRVAQLYPGARTENVLVTTGGAEANFLSTWSLVEPGDEVVFCQPNYLQISALAQSFGATVKPLWLREELQWQPDLEDLAHLVTPKTRFIAMCNPNNPTGAVLSVAAMDAVVAAASRVGAWIICDEIYAGAELDAVRTPTFWGRYDRVLATGGLSKAFGLPGLRTGWVVGPPRVIEQLWSDHDYLSMAPTMLTDRLASYAFGAHSARAYLRAHPRHPSCELSDHQGLGQETPRRSFSRSSQSRRHCVVWDPRGSRHQQHGGRIARPSRSADRAR